MWNVIPSKSDGNHFDFTSPWPTRFHPSTRDQFNDLIKYWGTHERKNLISFCGEVRACVHETAFSKTRSDRYEFEKICEKQTDCEIVKFRRTNGLSNLTWNSCENTYRDSIFCFNQGADQPSRRAVFQSMLMGCINVFGWDIMNQTNHVNSWKYLQLVKDKDYLVLNPEREDFMEVLRSISRERIALMQESIKNKLEKIVYSTKPSNFMDAIDHLIYFNFKKSISL